MLRGTGRGEIQRLTSSRNAATLIAEFDARGAKVGISQHPRHAKPLVIDEEIYKWRNLLENFLGKIAAVTNSR